MTATTADRAAVASAASTAPAARGTRSPLQRAVAYAVAAVRHVLTNVMFLFFTVALPVTMYLIFSGIYGGEKVAGQVTVAGVMMVTMAAYGGLGAAMNAGFQIHEEQRDGWFRQLSLTGLSPVALIAVRILTASLVIVPAIVALYVVGKFTQHVDLPWQAFATSGVVVWAALIPMVLVGLAIALWFPSSAGQALNTIVLMVLSVIGGLWFPIQMFPQWLQAISRFTPTYWIGQLGVWGVVGGAVPTRGLWTLLAWSLALVGLCAVGYRRAVRSSRR